MADWLFSSGGCAVERDFGDFERMQFRGGNASAYLEEMPILPGVWLYRTEAEGRCRFSIEVAGDAPCDGRIILGAILSSRGVLSLEGCGEQVWRDDGRSYVITPIERKTRYEFEVDRACRLVAVRLESEALDLLGADGIPETVRSVLEGKQDDLSEMAPLSGAIRAASHGLLRGAYTGRMQTIFQQAKVLDLLGHQLMAFGEGGDAQRLNAAELAKVRMARERLLADLREPPDLQTLASDVGLSAKRLNRGFRELFGTTVFTYLRDARLDAAKEALEGGTPVPLKQLAWSLGYGQVSNFITAFRRRYGVPPGSYRLAGGENYARGD